MGGEFQSPPIVLWLGVEVVITMVARVTMRKIDRLLYRDALIAAMERYQGLADAHGKANKLFYRRFFMGRAQKVRRLLLRDFADLHLEGPVRETRKRPKPRSTVSKAPTRRGSR
jgi:hypothetical protein